MRYDFFNFAMKCVLTDKNATRYFMVRKQPLETDVDGLYVSGVSSPSFSKQSKLTDLHRTAYEVKTDQKWIVFNWLKNMDIHFRLDRRTLELIVGKFASRGYSVDPETIQRQDARFSCTEISAEQFYAAIKPEFDRKQRALKL